MKKLQNGRVENLSQMPNGSKIVFAKELATLLNPYKIAICSLNVCFIILSPKLFIR